MKIFIMQSTIHKDFPTDFLFYASLNILPKWQKYILNYNIPNVPTNKAYFLECIWYYDMIRFIVIINHRDHMCRAR